MTPELPDGWEPIPDLCYPGNGSKAYHDPSTGASVHIVALTPSLGMAWVVQQEVPPNGWKDRRVPEWEAACDLAEVWMAELAEK